MPKVIVKESPISDAVSRRFFEAIAVLVDLEYIPSMQAFCERNGLSAPRYRAMRMQYGLTPKPGYLSRYRNLEVEAIYALVVKFPVSADWLISGRGEMLTRKKTKREK